ncbi:MAG: NAD(P)-dependent oxidoreductase [Pseudorhodobacter sp.]|nr:NAD(P)-dependent oxidoreductase [Pseudorhodobacter sp.]
MTMTRTVCVTEAVHEDALELLRENGFDLIEAATSLPKADALLVRIRPVQAAEVAQFEVISKHGVGVDNIPLAAAKAAGVAVMNTPGANSGAVAEQALMLMLALARDLDAQRAASGAALPPPRVAGLEGRRLLIVGFGASGKKLAALASALGMKVVVHSRSMNDARHAGYGVAPNLAAALPKADIVSLHCPLTEMTRHMLNAEMLALLPKGSYVINCARGGLIDEAALADALTSGALGGAGLDVTEIEPLPLDAALHAAPRLILTPHAAAMSDGAFRRMGMMAAQNILDHFAGRPKPDHTVVSKG